MKTILRIQNTHFYINGRKVYEEIPGCPEDKKGLLMNARFIQGVFDDRKDVGRFHRFGRRFDADENVSQLIEALPEWYECGLRAFTVGFQGGGPCYTIDSATIHNSPYSEDGTEMDEAYLNRMERIIRAADELGMIVIVSLFYCTQSHYLKDDAAVIEATKTACNWLRGLGAANVIIEIANEHDVDGYKLHPILYNDKGIVELIHIAQRESGGMPVGCSGTGAYFSDSIGQASDVILIHGNNQTRQQFYNHIMKAKAIKPERPIICNEDSQALSQMGAALRHGVSWGYYNNMTKQEPPVNWRITRGEDQYFAARMAQVLGIKEHGLMLEEQFYLQGFEPEMHFEGNRWIRLASLYPEKIDYVNFYRNGKLEATAYDDPFTINFLFNWLQKPVADIGENEEWTAEIVLVDGTVVVKKAKVSN